MKYMIHSCNKRLWYVKKYLIPSMIKEGIPEEDIILWNDDNGIGNLKSWVKSCEYIRDNLPMYDITWHMQDDVIICKNFKERTQNPPPNDLTCGFRCKNFNSVSYNKLGKRPLKNFLWGLQCVSIPNYLINHFVLWFYTYVVRDGHNAKRYSQNKFDDYFFLRFLQLNYPFTQCYNLEWSLVDHIDYLLGGTAIENQFHNSNINRAVKFDNNEAVEKLQKELEKK